MNGQRIARKYVERLTDKDLKGLLEAANNDPSLEAVVVAHLIKYEIEKRKVKSMKEILKALNKLGVVGSPEIKEISTGRIAVYIDNEYFGIWDVERKTFVD